VSLIHTLRSPWTWIVTLALIAFVVAAARIRVSVSQDRRLTPRVRAVAPRGAREYGTAEIEFRDDAAQCPYLESAQHKRRTLAGLRGLRAAPHTLLANRAGGRAVGARQFHVLDSLLAQQTLHALDGVTRVLQQIADAAQELYVRRPVEAAAAAPLHGLELWELDLPKTQDVLLDGQLGRHLADVAKCFCCL
jgi:hypothetical protein